MIHDEDDYEAIKGVFLKALEYQAFDERKAYLDEACGNDSALRASLDALLEEYEAGGGVREPLRASRPVRTSAFFVPGKILADRYRIVSLVGKGAMGEVYRADDLKLDQSVALKFLPAALVDDELLLKALYNEVKLARKVAHRHVSRIHDIGEAQGYHFLSMEFIEGDDLGGLLRQVGRLSPDKVIALARQLCQGLAAAHDEGLLHLDLKPGNLMIDKRGDLRVTDFGLARLAHEAEASPLLAGTPAYMAPEQLLRGEATRSSDLYAFGLVLWEMMLGKPLHEGRSTQEIVRYHQKSEIPMLMAPHLERVDNRIRGLVVQCLDEDPEMRPRSIHEVMVRLGDGRTAHLRKVGRKKPELHLDHSDVYISFAWIDDEPLTAEHRGWITMLQEDLELRIQKLSGKQVRISRLNKSIVQHDEADLRVLESLPNVKTMVSVLSPPFVNAKGCLKEVEAFWQCVKDRGNWRVSGTTRILKVVKTPVEREEIPEVVQPVFDGASGFDFFDVDPVTGRVMEYDEALDARARQAYFQRLYDLAHDVLLVLKGLNHDGAKTDRVTSSFRQSSFCAQAKTIYLAEVTSDLRSERNRLKRELLERGHTVLPDGALPVEQEALESTVRNWLAQADLALHPVGGRYGWVPEGGSLSFVELQNLWAAERSRDGDLRRLIWMPSYGVIEDQRQREVVAEFQTDPSYRLGAEVFGGHVNAFKDLILERLAHPPVDLDRPPASVEGGPRLVYLIADPVDEESLVELEDHLFAEGLEVRLPDFEAVEEEEISRAHRVNLIECDAVVIFYGKVRRAWVETKLRELMKAPGLGRKKPFLCKAVYLAPPFDGRKGRFKTHLAEVIRGDENFVPSSVGSVIDLLRVRGDSSTEFGGL